VNVGCPLCGQQKAVESHQDDVRRYDCPVCGTFFITGTAMRTLEGDVPSEERYRLSGLTRRASDAHKRLRIESSNVKDLLSSARVPRTPFDALDSVLLMIRGALKTLNGLVKIEFVDYPLIFARSTEELGEFIDHLRDQGYIKSKIDSDQSAWICQLTLDGWRRLEELQIVGRSSNQAFVAMWFDTDLAPAWKEGIEPALEEAGYQPLRIDQLAHNEKIDDKILVEIRKSGLMVADFTGNRGGVYFEAGFAMGLGIPVIWCVRETDIDAVHFDTRQYNHVTWRDPADLKERLYNRLVATMGIRSA
jgi:hypothetical protein